MNRILIRTQARALIIGVVILFQSGTNIAQLEPIIHLLLDEPDATEPTPGGFIENFDNDAVFTNPSLWGFVNPNGAIGSVNEGELILQLDEQLLWFNESQGVFAYRMVTGNFKASTSLRVHKTSSELVLPDEPVQLAGLMARNPASDEPNGSENYLFTVLGFDVNDFSIETKNTRDGQSVFEGPSWPNGNAELRLCRIDNIFYLYKRSVGNSIWLNADGPGAVDWPIERTDLPATLQIGLNIYTNNSAFDITAKFDTFSIEPVTTLSDCTLDSALPNG